MKYLSIAIAVLSAIHLEAYPYYGSVYDRHYGGSTYGLGVDIYHDIYPAVGLAFGLGLLDRGLSYYDSDPYYYGDIGYRSARRHRYRPRRTFRSRRFSRRYRPRNRRGRFARRMRRRFARRHYY